MMKNPFYKKTKMAGKTTEKTAAFKKAIKVLNHVPVDYAYTAEYSRYITNAEEEFRKKIKKIQVDDLCDDMFDAEIDAATDAMKASAAEQYTHHMNIILHNKGILDGEFHRLESEQELVKAKCSEAEAEIQTLKRMRKTPVSESGAKGSGITSCAVLVFVLIDLFIAKTPWNHVQSDGTLMAWLCALAIAIALDAPMALAGKALREHEQGFRSKQSRDLVVVASVAGFLIAFAFNMGFSIFTRSLSFSMDFGGEAEKETAIMFSAVFKAVIPLLTSISSFVISYFSCSPLDEKLKKAEQRLAEIQTDLITKETALSEIGNRNHHMLGLIARENDLYLEFINQLNAKAKQLKISVRMLIMEKLADPDTVTYMTRSGKAVMALCKIEEAPGSEYPAIVRKSAEDQKERVNVKSYPVAI